MTVLCLSIGHDANACLYSHGKVINYCLAERLDGIKGSANIYACIDFIFSSTSFESEKIDFVIATGTQGRTFLWSQPAKLRIYANSCQTRGYKKESDYQKILATQKLDDHFYLMDQYGDEAIQIAARDDIEMHQNPNKICDEFFPMISPPEPPSLHRLSQLNKGMAIMKSGKVSDIFAQPADCYLYNRNVSCLWVDHHLCHVLGALGRGFGNESSYYMSLDGATGAYSKVILDPRNSGYICQWKKEELLFHDWTYFCGGIIYMQGTKLLGLKEGKIMGLSSYICTIQPYLKEMIDNHLEKIWATFKDLNTVKDVAVHLKEHFGYELKNLHSINALAEKAEYCVEFDQRLSKDMPSANDSVSAYLIQSIYEFLLFKLFSIQQCDTFGRLVMSGGCALNATANRKIADKYPFLSIELDNACNDEGNSIGCAVLSDYIKTSFLRPLSNIKKSDIFFGSYPSVPLVFNSESLGNEDFDFIPDSDKDIIEIITKELCNEFVGVSFVGRYESGPRALGHRSLIALSHYREAHFVLNRIKSREYWRPIAPMVRDIDFTRYFSGIQNKHMIMTNICISKEIPAVSHIDETSRVQVISCEHSLYKLLSYISNNKDLPPVICNTSLNGRNQPIFNSLQQVLGLAEKNQEITFIILDNGLLIRKRL